MKIVFCLIFFSLSFFEFAGASQVITETVGQVADYVVTSREVKISMALEGVLYQVGKDDFRTAATAVLLEVVVALEAENFNVAHISEEEIQAAIAKIETAVSGRGSWRELEVSEAELKKFTRRKLVAKSFLKFKTSSMSGIITDQEAQNYYDKNRIKFGTATFEAFKGNIKSFLAQQQLEERLRSWFEVVKRKYKVRNFIAN